MSAIQDQPPEHRARAPQGPDPKWRYMWRIGKRPAETQFQELNAEPVVPAGDSLPACTCLILGNCHGLRRHSSSVTDQIGPAVLSEVLACCELLAYCHYTMSSHEPW